MNMDISSMYSALTTVKLLRLEVGNLFSSISEGLKEEHGEDGREFVNEIQRMINTVHQRYRELEQSVNNIPLAAGNLNLQNTSYLTQEGSSDKLALYSPLVRSHKWIEKVHKYSSLAHGILNSNSPRKCLFLSFVYSKRRRIPSGHIFSNSPNWDNILQSLDRLYPDSSMVVHKTFPTNVVLQVTMGRVLQAMIAFKGFVIEWVVVKAFNESCNTPADLMSESRYNVFRRVTDHAHAATLHFAMLHMPEVMMRSYLAWLHSYASLFTATCKQCGKHSYDCYPPTWRDFRTMDAYHFECKP